MFLKKNFHYLKIISIIFSLSMLVTCGREKKVKAETNIDDTDVVTTDVVDEENINEEEEINKKKEEEKKQHDAHMQHLSDIHDEIIDGIVRIDFNDVGEFIGYETITTNDFARHWQCCQEIQTKITNYCQEEKDLDVILKPYLNLLDEKQNWMIENHHHPLVILLDNIFHFITWLPITLIIITAILYFKGFYDKLKGIKAENLIYLVMLTLCFIYVIHNLFNINAVNFNQSLYNTFMAIHFSLCESNSEHIDIDQNAIAFFFVDRSRFFYYHHEKNIFYYRVPLLFDSADAIDFFYLMLYFIGLLGLFPYQQFRYVTDKDVIDQKKIYK